MNQPAPRNRNPRNPRRRGRGRARLRPIFVPYNPRFYNRRFRPLPPRRFAPNRRPRLRIVYGQEQDFVSNPTPPPSRGVGKTFITPVSESKTVTSFFQFKNNSISLCQPIPSVMYNTNTAIINLHPMLFPGRMANLALNFECYQIIDATIHTVPLIGTTSTGMVAVGSVQKCVSLSYDASTHFSQLTQLNAMINPVWMSTKYKVQDLDTSIKQLTPSTRNDMPNTIFIVGSGLGGALNVSMTVFIELRMKMLRPTPLVSLSTSNVAYTFISSGAGVRSNSIIYGPSYGIVLTSTALNLDVGELVFIPPFDATATDYATTIIHNGVELNYLQARDQGTFVVQIILGS